MNVTPSVRIVELPGLPPKGDVSDWVAAGGSYEQFQELMEAAVHLDAGALSELRARWELDDYGVARAAMENYWPKPEPIS